MTNQTPARDIAILRNNLVEAVVHTDQPLIDLERFAGAEYFGYADPKYRLREAMPDEVAEAKEYGDYHDSLDSLMSRENSPLHPVEKWSEWERAGDIDRMHSAADIVALHHQHHGTTAVEHDDTRRHLADVLMEMKYRQFVAGPHQWPHENQLVAEFLHMEHEDGRGGNYRDQDLAVSANRLNMEWHSVYASPTEAARDILYTDAVEHNRFYNPETRDQRKKDADLMAGVLDEIVTKKAASFRPDEIETMKEMVAAYQGDRAALAPRSRFAEIGQNLATHTGKSGDRKEFQQ